MKRILGITALAFSIVLFSAVQNKASAQYDNPNTGNDVSYQDFYDELSPYGDWIEYPEYGYVWQPRMGDDFRPYSTGGQWVWNDEYEWMWVSDYDWGWAPFHYGRWFEDDNYGWLWQPGYEWSPAWVAWRDGGDNYGWAPLRPGINISIGFNIGSYNPPISYWNFAPRRYITSHNIYSYCLPWRQNSVYYSQTVIINNYNYGGNYGFRTGPRRYEAERYCGPIRSVSFRQSYTPGRTQFRNNQVSIYRPNVRQDNGNRNFAPRQFNRYDRQSTGNRSFDRNDNRNVRTNNLPNRQDRTPQNNNGNNDRRFDRNNGQTNPNGGVRTPRPVDNPNTGNNDRRFDRNNGQSNPNGGVRTPRPVDNPNTGNNDRRFDRNNGQSNPNGGVRTPRPVDNPNTGNNDRRFDRNNGQSNPNGGVRTPRQVERPVDQNPGNNNRQFDRRTTNPGNPNREMRQQPTQQPQRQPSQQPQERRVQEQPRQIERRSEGNGNRQQPATNGGGGNSSNRGGGNGRRF